MKLSSFPVNQDTRFWADGVMAGKLLLQRCARCAALRHPPQPMCGQCHSFDWSAIEASGRGHVYSYVVHHRPQIEGFASPHCVVLVELEEGVRMIGETSPPGLRDIAIGTPVEAVIERDAAGDVELPRWRPADDAA